MKALQCPSCGAPLEPVAGSVFATCDFCGATAAPTQHFKSPRPAHPAPQVSVQVVDLSRHRLKPRQLFGCALAVFLLVAGIAVFVFVRAQGIQRSIRERIDTAQRIRVSPDFRVTREEVALPVARLAEASFTGRHVIAATPPPGGFAAFEPVAGLPWALAIAQVWSRDAKLERLDVDRVRPDGTVNVTDDPEAGVMYRFVSPSRLQALRERMNLEKSPRGDQEFWVEIEEGKVYAYELQSLSALVHDDDAAELAQKTWPKSLPLTTIVPALAKRRDVPAVPFFEGYLIWLEDEGWCWYISTLSGSPNIPRVRARDGRVWPY